MAFQAARRGSATAEPQLSEGASVVDGGLWRVELHVVDAPTGDGRERVKRTSVAACVSIGASLLLPATDARRLKKMHNAHVVHAYIRYIEGKKRLVRS